MSLNTQICPVCNMGNIDNTKSKCPQCGSDLTCFKVLDSIPNEVSKQELPKGIGEIPGKIDSLLEEVRKILSAIVNNTPQVIQTHVHDRPEVNPVHDHPKIDPVYDHPEIHASSSDSEKSLIYTWFFCSFIFLLLFFTLYFAFYRINSLEKSVKSISRDASKVNSERNAQIAKLKQDYLELDKNLTVKLLNQELKYNKLLDEKTQQMIGQINKMSKSNQDVQDRIQLALHQLTTAVKTKQGEFAQSIKTQIKETLEHSNAKVDAVSTQLISLLKEFTQKKQSSPPADNVYKLKVDNQQIQIVELLKILENTLQQNAQHNKEILSLLTIKMFEDN